MTYRLTGRAGQDVLDIWKYIADDDEAAADRYFDLRTRRFVLLGNNPHAGRRRDDLRAGYRSFRAGEHLMFYRIAEPGTQILHIVHSNHDIASVFRR